MPPKPPTDEDEEKTSSNSTSNAYQMSAEERRVFIINVVGYSIIGIMAILTMTLALGDRFFGLQSFLGIRENAPGFVLADCSLEQNKGSRKCKQGESTSEKDWRDIKHSGKDYTPFRLWEGP